MLAVLSAFAAICQTQLPLDQVLIDRYPARPWYTTQSKASGNATIALPNVAVVQESTAVQPGQALTYDPMVFLQQCDAVVLCNRHIYACSDAPLHCFLGDHHSSWVCPLSTLASCWTVIEGQYKTNIPIDDKYVLELKNNTALVYKVPSTIMATQHLALAFGMLAIAIALQQNIGSHALQLNWSAAITSVLVTTSTESRLNEWPHAAITAAAAFLTGRYLFKPMLPHQNSNLRAVAIVAALSSMPVEKLGITPMMYSAFVVSLCIAAEAQDYHWLQTILLTLWASAAIDNTIAAAYMYPAASFNEISLSVAVTLSSAAAGVLGK